MNIKYGQMQVLLYSCKMNLRRFLVFLGGIVLLGTCGAQAREQQTYPGDQFYLAEGLSFPYNNQGINVTDHQLQQWVLQINPTNLYFYSVLTSDYAYSGSELSAILYDTQSQSSYYIYASGSLTPENYRISPDLKWATLSNIFMRGGSHYYDMPFNFTISYADFWSDSPANNLYNMKQIEYSDDENDDDCEKELIDDGGFNYPASRDFWLTFDFDDGKHLYFNIPSGYTAYIYRNKELSVNEGCDPRPV